MKILKKTTMIFKHKRAVFFYKNEWLFISQISKKINLSESLTRSRLERAVNKNASVNDDILFISDGGGLRMRSRDFPRKPKFKPKKIIYPVGWGGIPIKHLAPNRDLEPCLSRIND